MDVREKGIQQILKKIYLIEKINEYSIHIYTYISIHM